MIVTVTPNPSVDWTLEIPTLTRGAVHRITGQHQEPSGKGVNVTRALTGNGVASLAVLPVGGPEGAELEALLQAEQVAYRAVPVAGSVRVNISLTEPDGTATKINATGPTLSRRGDASGCWPRPSRRRRRRLGARVGQPARRGGRDFYARLGDAVRGSGARFALDSSGPAAARGAARPDPTSSSRTPRSSPQAVGRPLSTLGDAVVAARELMALGAATVVVSLGSDGALLVDECGRAARRGVRRAPRRAPSAPGTRCSRATSPAPWPHGGDRAAALREAVAWGSAAVRVDGQPGPGDHRRRPGGGRPGRRPGPAAPAVRLSG